MKGVTAAAMRELDRRTIEEAGVPGAVLMERAGRAVARAVDRLAAWSGRRGGVWVVAGKGNNGGDAFVAARLLHEAGRRVHVVLAAEAGALTGDAALHYARMLEAGVKPVPLEALPAEAGGLDAPDPEQELVVDGILGTGTAGAPRGAAAQAIACVNRLGGRRPVVAIDIPSGLDADTGAAPGAVVRADWTVTMGCPKAGLARPAALEWVGVVEVAPIGIPAAFRDGAGEEPDLITPVEVAPCVGRRPRAAHKGTYGHVLLVGGSPGYAGAMVLAARAALRSGAGLVSVLAPASVAAVIAGAVPGAMVHAGAAGPDGALAADALARWPRRPAAVDALLVGPGLSRGPGALELAARLAVETPTPLVLDADALPDPAAAGALRQAAGPRVLTPHPGEMGRLLGCSASDVQADRAAAARRAAALTGAVTVLKGGGTLVAEPGGRLAVNLTGNPGMATGGMGDVLGGLLAGLLAQGCPVYEAACAAVWLHGSAGDAAAWRVSQPALTADDVVEALPEAFRRL